jgi:hypothetical protein
MWLAGDASGSFRLFAETPLELGDPRPELVYVTSSCADVWPYGIDLPTNRGLLGV